MRYVMRQKLLSLAVSFTIKDESGREAYYVKGEPFRFGNKLSLQDTNGIELVHIDQRPLNWVPTYELWRDGGLLAVVERPRFPSAVGSRSACAAPTISKPTATFWITSTSSRAVIRPWQSSRGAGSPSPLPAGLKSIMAKMKLSSSLARSWSNWSAGGAKQP